MAVSIPFIHHSNGNAVHHENLTVGFIGGGRAAKIILHGWKQARSLPNNLMVIVPDAEVLQITKE